MKFPSMRLLAVALVAGMAMGSNLASALVVTGSSDASALVALIIGAGVTTSNETYVGVGDSATPFQSGSFSEGSVIGIDHGLIMTTGDIEDAPGPNISGATTVVIGSAGDTDLDALTGENATQDAAVLEFDFVTSSGDLFFDWVFASEEYNEFVATRYNDVFAFWVNDTNIAQAPDGQVASVNTINCGNPYDSTTAGTNCDSFNNNERQNGVSSFNIEYDGFTDVFTASVLGLGAGTHHIKIAIADTSDGQLDSAVFFKGSSFTGGAVPLPGTLALVALGLLLLRSRWRGMAVRCQSGHHLHDT